MKKFIVILTMMIFVMTTLIGVTMKSVLAASTIIPITIPNGKLARVKSAMLIIYPNNNCSVPDPNDPENCISYQYSDNQWLKEVIRKFIVRTVRKGERIQARRAADTNQLKDHNTLAQ